MAKISTMIQLNDMVSSPLQHINNTLNMTVSSFERLDSAANVNFGAVRQEVAETNAELERMQQQLQENNQAAEQQSSRFSGLTSKVMGLVGAYAGLQGLKSVIGLSDELTLTTARLDLMNDGLQSTEELQQKIFQSAQASRDSYQATADAVSKMGILAGDAFSGNDELIAFMEQVNKQFTIAGTSQEGQAAAMLQLTQAMGAGVLRGEELNSIFEQAPTMIQSIADYLNKPIGEIRTMASEGQITSEVVKNAMLAAADETNKKLESMPMTFGQVMQSVKNQALMAFQPVFDQLSQLANSPQFSSMVDGMIGGLSTVAGVVVQIFSVVASVGGFIADNWSLIAPVVGAAAAALSLYIGYLAVKNGLELVSNGLSVAVCLASYAKAAATGAEVSATAAATAAQHGFNTALLACPLTWILLLIIAVVAAFYAVIAVINKTQNKTISATGVIVGALATAGAFIWNLLASLVNGAISLFAGLWNFLAGFANFFANFLRDPLGAAAHLIASFCETALNLLSALASAIDAIFGSDLVGTINGWIGNLNGWADSVGNGKYQEEVQKINPQDYYMDRKSYSGAYSWGYGKGSSAADTVKSKLNSSMGSKAAGLGSSKAAGSGGTGSIGKGVNNIDKNTSKINDAVQSSSEDLKLIRQLAERAAINKITTTNVKVDMTGMTNQINDKDRDIDGFINTLTKKVEEAFLSSAEGVHE